MFQGVRRPSPGGGGGILIPQEMQRELDALQQMEDPEMKRWATQRLIARLYQIRASTHNRGAKDQVSLLIAHVKGLARQEPAR